MSIRRLHLKCALVVGLSCLLFCSPAANAALVSWDPDGNQISDGGPGTWSTTDANWDDDGSPPNVAWTNSDDAAFGDAGAAYAVSVADGINVGSISVSTGTGKVSLQGVNDNDGLSVSGSATWDTGGRELEIVGNQANDLRVTIGTGQTLTITGAGGTFDAGEKPNGADWVGTGATLDFQSAALRGAANNIGQIDTVKMAAGSRYIHERNTNQTYNNAWEVSGEVEFDNRFNARNMTFDGVVSGAGTVVVKDIGSTDNNGFIRLTGTNTFTGGVVVDSTNSRAELQVTTTERGFGAVPGTFDSDNITLRNGGELKMNGITINPNRGIALDGGGVIVNTGNANTYGGTISGTGGLQIGRQQGADGNALILTSDTHTYTGGTHIFQGRVQLGIDNALPTDQLLTIGGKGTSRLDTKGFDQEIGGLQTSGNNTRQIFNDGGSVSTLTIDVPNGESYSYIGTFAGGDGVAVVKEGDGTQIFNKTTSAATPLDSLTINQGTFLVDGDVLDNMVGPVAVNGGTLGGNGLIGGPITIGASGTVAPGTSIGTLNTTSVEVSGTLEVEYDGDASFAEVIDLLVVSGALNITNATVDFDDLGSSPLTEQAYIFATYDSLIGSTFANVLDMPTNYFIDYAYDNGSTSTNIALVVVPEPSQLLTFTLLSVSIALGVKHRERALAL